MADLAFTVDYKQLKAANAELERTGKVSKNSAQAFEAAFSQVVKWQQKFATEQGKVSAKLEETYRKQNLANKSARDSARAFEEAERATKRLAQTKEELSRKYKPLYAQSKLYERSLEEINQANKLGVLTDKQRQVSIQELNQAFTTGTGVFSKYASEASRRTNQMGVVTQQVGYQVGDFLVQVQSGTNVMVAFGQQATQLVGVLPLMGAGFMGLSQVALVGLSAGLGIAIPLVTAIGAAFLRTRESTNSAKDAISELDSALKSLDSTLKNWVQSKKAAAAGVTVEELLGTTGLEQAETNLANAKSKLELARALERSTGGVGVVGAAATAYNFFAGGSVEQLEEEVRKAEERVRTLKKKNLDEEKADRNENVANMIQVFRDAQKRMREEDEETRRLREENQLSMIEVFRAAQKRMRDEQAATDAEIAKGYANSLGFSKQLTNETDAYVKSAIEGFKQTEKLKEQLGDAAYEALRLAGVDMESGVDKAAIAAANLAAKMGVSLEAALALQELGATADNKFMQMYESGQFTGTPNQSGYRSAEYHNIIDRINNPDAYGVSSGGGGSKTDSQLEQFISSLMTERETLEQWRTEQFDLLAQYNDTELEMIGGQTEAKLRLEQEYQDRLAKIRDQERSTRLTETANMFSALAAVAGAGGKKMLKVQAVISAASATVAAYETAIKAAAEAKTIPGRIAAYASFLATGLGAVAKIRSAGGIGGGGGASGSEAIMPTQAAAPTPQRVIIEGIDRNSLFSGEQLSNIFEAIYEENENRGMVFEVAR